MGVMGEDAPLDESENTAPSPLEKLGDLLQLLRIKANLDIEEAAADAGCSCRLVSEVESGAADFEEVMRLLPVLARTYRVRLSFLEKELARYAGLIDDE